MGLSACGGSNGGGADDPVDDDPSSDVGDNGDGGGGGSTDPVTFSIGGSITGNAGDVVLALNGGNETFSGGDFTFTNAVEEGADYSVRFISEASGRDCALTNGSGTASADVSDISVTCEAPPVTVETFSVGGTISGNAGDVVLSLNGVEQSFSGVTFMFDREIEPGDAYVVAFESETTGMNCRVEDGAGRAQTDINNIEVSCTSSVVVLGYPDVVLNGGLSSGDYNDDGHTDLAISFQGRDNHPNGTTEMIKVAYGDGNGGFPEFVDVFREGRAILPINGNNFTSADFNGDGIDDFAHSGDVLQVYSGSANNMPTNIANGSEYFGAPLISADFDQDGDQDFIAANPEIAAVSLFAFSLNEGGGAFGDRQPIGNRFAPELVDLNAGAPLSFVSGDFDGDGLEDILSLIISWDDSDVSHNALALFSGNGDSTFDYLTVIHQVSDEIFLGGRFSDKNYKDLAVGDFDGDGDLDVAISSRQNFLSIWLNDGAGHFIDNGRVTVGQASVRTRAADFNNDGLVDLVTANQNTNNLVISLGNGDGTFVAMPDAIEFRLDSEIFMHSMEVADIDDDGYVDVVLVDTGTNDFRGAVYIFLAPGK